MGSQGRVTPWHPDPRVRTPPQACPSLAGHVDLSGTTSWAALRLDLRESLMGCGDQSPSRALEPTCSRLRGESTDTFQFVQSPTFAEVPQLPDDHFVYIHAHRILFLGHLLNRVQQRQKVLPHLS